MSGEGVHRRFDPLAGEWVLVSPHRARRPWQGHEDAPAPPRPAYDPECHLCPGNARAGGARNPDYAGVFVFDNDFPALVAEPGEAPTAGLLRSAPVRGRSRVLCFDARHDRTLAELDDVGRVAVIDAWMRETADLGADHAWVQCFENKGTMMGCSSPHPHGQIWALDTVPTQPARESAHQSAHRDAAGRPLLLDVLDAELATGERVVAQNGRWVALVPYWARWPFELLILPRAHRPALTDLDAEDVTTLAAVLGTALGAEDNLFRCESPYSLGWHGAPTDADARTRAAWQLHAHVYPPLLRSASVRKFMVGFEMLAEAQRDLTPETAAARLRDACGPHWRGA